MQFDDRLATVLRMRAGSDAVLRTQFRQLLDLLGTARAGEGAEVTDAAYARLGELMQAIPQEDQSKILRGPGLRLRNAELVAFLARGEAKPAAAAMATAQLAQGEWLALIPALPVNARGFLRHRRGLPERVVRQLAELGVRDLVLPDPGIGVAARKDSRPLQLEPAQPVTPTEGIGALLRRIEKFRKERQAQAAAPRLPLEDDAEETRLGFEFATDASGHITWAGGPFAPQLVGFGLMSSRASRLLHRGKRIDALLSAHQPLREEPIAIDAGPAISGEWVCDAAPLFDIHTGGFTGYRGCLRRPSMGSGDGDRRDSAGELMRQVLHELRTPVNAIQGFAEIIQQQLFGPAPHEYRAHAAAIAVDAAKLLAGFDEVDRLVKLEGGALELEEGTSDFRAAIEDTVQRLQGVLRPRGAGFELQVTGDGFVVALERGDALALGWRLLATAAGALAPGETITLKLRRKGDDIRLRMRIPAYLLETAVQRPADSNRRRAVSAGMFGPHFAFRLAQAEARAAGGSLTCQEDRVTLLLPALTAILGDHSETEGLANG